MRHGSVDYFTADGTPVPPHTVPLNDAGRTQADAAGSLFAAAGVRFDRVLVSGLARTVETARRVLAAAGQDVAIAHDPRLEEIRPGRLDAIAPDRLRAAFTGVFSAAADVESLQFLGGETVGAMMDRCLPAFDELLADPAWHCALLVLHGGINRALLGHALTGRRTFLGRRAARRQRRAIGQPTHHRTRQDRGAQLFGKGGEPWARVDVALFFDCKNRVVHSLSLGRQLRARATAR